MCRPCSGPARLDGGQCGLTGRDREYMEVNESGMIRVLKRDGTVEPFDTRKLAGAMWRAMRGTPGRYEDACQLALAMKIYIGRDTVKVVSSVQSTRDFVTSPLPPARTAIDTPLRPSIASFIVTWTSIQTSLESEVPCVNTCPIFTVRMMVSTR